MFRWEPEERKEGENAGKRKKVVVAREKSFLSNTTRTRLK